MAVLIKRYANRKLYDTESSRYITLKVVSALIRSGREVHVVDNLTGNDITPVILSRVLVDEQQQSVQTSSGRLLSELIQRGNPEARTEPESGELSREMRAMFERVLRDLDLPTRAGLESLNKNLERLANALQSFESRLPRN